MGSLQQTKQAVSGKKRPAARRTRPLTKTERITKYNRIYLKYCNEMWIHCGDCGEDRRAYSYVSLREIVVPMGVFSDPSEWDLIVLLHEIGHIKTNKESMKMVVKEYLATQWMADESKKWEIPVKKLYADAFQKYIWEKRKLSIARGGKNVPSEEELAIRW